MAFGFRRSAERCAIPVLSVRMRETHQDRSGLAKRTEKLWREFFSDPSQWWDHRPEKANARYPDFKHKIKQEALWLDSKWKPYWVEEELANMAAGTVQSNVFSWNTKLAKYVKAGYYYKAIELFQHMQREGMHADSFTFVPLLNACASLQALDEGRYIHKQIVKCCCESDVYVGNSLVDMYVKCESIEDALKVFNKMPTRNVVSWNVMILGHVKCGQGEKALGLYRQMQWERVDPVPSTFVAVLSACARLTALEEGRNVHNQIIRNGCESDLLVGSSLVDMYAKCGCMEEAWRLFKKMPTRNVVSWSAMILGYVKCGQEEKGLRLYKKMRAEGVELDTVIFVAALNACARLRAIEEGRHIHGQIMQSSCESNVFVGSSLIDMYSKCGSIEDAWQVFKKMTRRDVVAWSAMIVGYARCGQGQKALELSQAMQREGVEPVSVTFVGMLNACASLESLQEGRRVHEQIIQSGCIFDVFLGSSLVDMYAKCGSIDDAWRVFKEMPTRNVVSWNSIILAHVKSGQGLKALELSQEMQREGVAPVPATFVGMLNACASIVALEDGRCVHEQIIQSGYEFDVFVCSGLIDMYAKCGSIVDAERVFNNIPKHDAVIWGAMLGGYAMHGHAEKALRLFEWMRHECVDIDEVTFVALLTACSHAGLVDEGRHYVQSMGSVYRLSPTVEHYVCMVDLLGRAGYLHEAEDLIKTMSCEPNATLWMALLSACKVHGQVEMGERVAKHVLELDPKNVTGYLLLSNIYAFVGKSDSEANV